MNPPREIETDRLLLRAPREGDAELVYERYAADAEVTRYVAFSRHRSIEDARGFIAVALEEWGKGNPMAYLAFTKADGHRLVGSTGLVVESSTRGSTGYVLARDAWGHGFATEMARAMVDLAFNRMRMWRISAICHVDHHASEHVLEKAGFMREGVLRRHTVFPNMESSSEPQDVAIWARTGPPPST